MFKKIYSSLDLLLSIFTRNFNYDFKLYSTTNYFHTINIKNLIRYFNKLYNLERILLTEQTKDDLNNNKNSELYDSLLMYHVYNDRFNYNQYIINYSKNIKDVNNTFEYVKAICWCFAYYMNKNIVTDNFLKLYNDGDNKYNYIYNINKTFCYKHVYSPLLYKITKSFLNINNDILLNLENDIYTNKTFKFIKYSNLLSILPKHSFHVIPEYITSKDKVINLLKNKKYFPDVIMIDCNGSDKEYKCTAVLDFIDYDIIKKILS